MQTSASVLSQHSPDLESFTVCGITKYTLQSTSKLVSRFQEYLWTAPTAYASLNFQCHSIYN